MELSGYEIATEVNSRSVSFDESKIEEYTVELYSDYGKQVYSKTTREKTFDIDTRSYSKGFYVLKIISNDTVITRHIEVR